MRYSKVSTWTSHWIATNQTAVKMTWNSFVSQKRSGSGQLGQVGWRLLLRIGRFSWLLTLCASCAVYSAFEWILVHSLGALYFPVLLIEVTWIWNPGNLKIIKYVIKLFNLICDAFSDQRIAAQWGLMTGVFHKEIPTHHKTSKQTS